MARRNRAPAPAAAAQHNRLETERAKADRIARQDMLAVTARDPQDKPPKRLVDYADYRSPGFSFNLTLFLVVTSLYIVSRYLDIVSKYDEYLNVRNFVFIYYWNITVFVGLLRLFFLFLYYSKHWCTGFCLYLLVHSANLLVKSMDYNIYRTAPWTRHDLYCFILACLPITLIVIYCTSRSHSCLRCDYCLRYRPVHNANGIRKDEDVPRIPPEIDPEKSKILYAKCLGIGFCQQAECPPFLDYDLILLTVQYFVSMSMTLFAFTVNFPRTGTNLDLLEEIMKDLRIRSILDQLFFLPAATAFQDMVPNENVTNVFHNYTTSWSIEEMFCHFCILPHACLNE